MDTIPLCSNFVYNLESYSGFFSDTTNRYRNRHNGIELVSTATSRTDIDNQNNDVSEETIVV